MGWSLACGLMVLGCSSASPRPSQEGEVAVPQLGGETDAGSDGGAPPDSGGAAQADVSAAPPPNATAIAVGAAHACAVTSDGSVYCWGSNRFGQLGDGTTTSRSAPVAVVGLPAGARAIAAGDQHTCALLTTGDVFCWGTNASAALGDGSKVSQRSTPAAVAGLSGGIVALGAGGGSTCGVTASGAAQCWGANDSGQLGDGSATDGAPPAPIQGVLASAATTPGAMGPAGDHSCILGGDGSVVCAGDGTNGALGNGGNATTTTYVMSGITGGALAVGSSYGTSCALLEDGTVDCWGYGGGGELGNGGTMEADTPGPVTGLANATGVAVGLHHACAVAAGSVWCWGDNQAGDLGDGSGKLQDAPVSVPAFPSGGSAVAVAAGGGTCALTGTGAVYCWGPNDAGQVGDGTTTERDTPARVVGLGAP